MLRFVWMALLLCALVFSGCRPAPEASSLSVQKLVVALKPDKNPEKMVEEKLRLEAFLSSELELPVEVTIPLSGAVIEEGLANGSLDLAYLSASGLLKAQKAGVAELLLAGEIDGKTTYESYWVTLVEKPFAMVSDLRNRPIAFASKTSTSGYVIPYADLIRQGLLLPQENPEVFFGNGNVFFGSGYVSAIEQVFNGTADAAAVSDYVLNLDAHLTPDQKSRLRVLARQGPVPTHVIAVRKSLPEQDRVRVKAALAKLNLPENQALRDKVFTSKLVEADFAEHVAPLQEAFQLTGLGN